MTLATLLYAVKTVRAALVTMSREEENWFEKNGGAYDAATAVVVLCNFVRTEIEIASKENRVPTIINSHVLRRLASWLDNTELPLPSVNQLIEGE